MGLWWDPFVQIRKCMSLKLTGELFVMTMKIDTKFEEELTCQLKTDMRNLTDFDLNTSKSWKFAFYWATFDQSIQCLTQKKYRQVMFDGTEDWCKIWRKTGLCFLEWHEEFGKFLFTGWKIVISFYKGHYIKIEAQAKKMVFLYIKSEKYSHYDTVPNLPGHSLTWFWICLWF